jgi:hypothetical protein
LLNSLSPLKLLPKAEELAAAAELTTIEAWEYQMMVVAMVSALRW